MPPLTYGNSDIGLNRERNEDNYLVANELGLFAVADGIGGLPYGEQASGMAVQCLKGWAEANNGVCSEEHFLDALAFVNEAITEEGEKLAEDTGIGSTISAIAVNGSSVIVGHVGDSSVFVFRKTGGGKLTTDHTIAQEIFDRLDPGDEMPDIPDYYHHSLTRCLGQQENFKPDAKTYELFDGDRLLACTDGITDLIGANEMQEMAMETDSPKDLVTNLINIANQRGGHDNSTAVAVYI